MHQRQRTQTQLGYNSHFRRQRSVSAESIIPTKSRKARQKARGNRAEEQPSTAKIRKSDIAQKAEEINPQRTNQEAKEIKPLESKSG